MSQNEAHAGPVQGDDIVRAVGTLTAAASGDAEVDDRAYEEAMEPGLNEHQRAVAERYAGEGRIEVDSSRTPRAVDKLAAGAKLPWTFVVDGVEFVKKTSYGFGSSTADSEWRWSDDGFHFHYYKFTDRPNEIRIEEVEA